MMSTHNTLLKGQWTEFRKHYDIGPVIGSGSFSVVCTVIHRSTGLEYAAKFTSREEADKELDSLRSLKTPRAGNILSYHDDAFEDDTGQYKCLVSELMEGPNLQEALEERGSYSEEDARDILRHILEGLKDIHTSGMVHRDLKLENVLLPSEERHTRVKIADFGLSTSWSDSKPKLRKRCGTPIYVAPEVLPSDCEYDNKVDVWSAGVILYMLLSGCPPFWGESVPELLRSIMKHDLRFSDPVWELVSPAAKDLIRGMMTKDPSSRLSAEEALGHSWMLVE